MTRREVFAVLGGAVALGAVGATALPVRKFGRLTVTGHLAHKHATGEDLRVSVDGVDVTRRCYEADDVEGYALVFCTDPQEHRDWTKAGHLHVSDGRAGACKLRLNGNVVIRPGGGAA